MITMSDSTYTSGWLVDKEKEEGARATLRKVLSEANFEYYCANYAIATALPELEECPFCKNKLVYVREDYGDAYVHCPKCNARGPGIYLFRNELGYLKALEKAVNGWNRRAEA